MAISTLLVEADDLTRLTIANMIEAMSFNVVAVKTSSKALNAMQAITFDILITGSAPDEIDGISMAEQAKRLHQDVKVMMVSGRDAPDTACPYIDYFLRKPFSLDQIGEAVKQLASTIPGTPHRS